MIIPLRCETILEVTANTPTIPCIDRPLIIEPNGRYDVEISVVAQFSIDNGVAVNNSWDIGEPSTSCLIRDRKISLNVKAE